MDWQTILDADARWSNQIRLSQPGGVFFRAAAVFAHSGDSWFWLAGLGLIWMFGSPSWRSRAALMIIGLVFLAVMILAIKFRVRRRRPEGEWGAIYRLTDPHSFPSGHAARAAFFAVLAVGLGPAWFGVLLALWAPLVSLARVVMGVHYLSDILAGVVIGLLMGILTLFVQPYLVAWLPFLF